MTCEEIREKLVELIDGELSSEADHIKEHLDICPDCQQELNSLIKLKKLFRSWKDIRPSTKWKVTFEEKLSQIERERTLTTIEKIVSNLNERLKLVEQALKSIQSENLGEIMTLDELARYLKLSPEQLLEIIEQIPNVRIGSEYRFIRQSIDRWLKSLEHDPYTNYYNWSLDLYEE